jgi:hypothetical protein
MAYGLWLMAYGLWLMAYGLWLMAYGLWLMAYGVSSWVVLILRFLLVSPRSNIKTNTARVKKTTVSSLLQRERC